MKEQDLIALGFKKGIMPDEESGHTEEWYYYTYSLTKKLELISNDNEDAEREGWYVEFYNLENKIRFTNIRELAKLITIIENAKR